MLRDYDLLRRPLELHGSGNADTPVSAKGGGRLRAAWGEALVSSSRGSSWRDSTENCCPELEPCGGPCQYQADIGESSQWSNGKLFVANSCSATSTVGLAAAARSACSVGNVLERRRCGDDADLRHQAIAMSSHCCLNCHPAALSHRDLRPGESGAMNTCSTPSSSRSRSVLREVNSQARFESLHQDAAFRKQRQERARQEKLRQEEAENKAMLRPSARRAWEPQWAKEQGEAFTRRMIKLEVKRVSEAWKREQDEMRECSFAPRLISQRGGSRGSRGRQNKQAGDELSRSASESSLGRCVAIAWDIDAPSEVD
mmetsp:Transcript_54191/g.101581  ORF Transcript_54191/g.101581 Transcript_54191/m.101581 type:complete len:314 (-) Transcript_54191:104-1045(-)